MALSGLEIYKLLPKTNCGECGFPTCLAFAMQLAAGKAELEKCPDVSPEAAEALGSAAAPPIMPVGIGVGERHLVVGEETVLYRHEKRFEHPTLLAALIDDAEPEKTRAEMAMAASWSVERVGQELRFDMLCVRSSTGDGTSFKALAEEAAATGMPVMLSAGEPALLATALEACAEAKPLLHLSGPDHAGAIAQAKEKGLPLSLRGEGLEGAAAAAAGAAVAGLKELILDTGAKDGAVAFSDSVRMRRSALRAEDRSLSYPPLFFPCDMTDDPLDEAMIAGSLIAKYGAIVVLSGVRPSTALPLLVLRQNIFTDPQRPMQMDEGIYPINSPGADSPLLITTNFSLTYFTVANEIEASRVPTWLLVMDTEGLSVLTAWSAGKFGGDSIAAFVKKSGITDSISHRSIVLPGYVAQISGELQEELDGDWEVSVGVREAGDIPKFLKAMQG